MKVASVAVVGAWLAGVAEAQVVQWEVERRQAEDDSSLSQVRRRDTTFEAAISNRLDKGGYFINCQLGTPSQNLTLQLDTGSSDIWVPSSSAKICSSTSAGGCKLGSCKAPFPSKYLAEYVAYMTY